MFPGQMRVITGDAFKFLGRSPLNYDFIFADPPYELDGIADIPNLVFASKSLKSDALFILEHSIAHSFAEHPNFVKEKKYGKVHFSFFKNKPTE